VLNPLLYYPGIKISNPIGVTKLPLEFFSTILLKVKIDDFIFPGVKA